MYMYMYIEYYRTKTEPWAMEPLGWPTGMIFLQKMLQLNATKKHPCLLYTCRAVSEQWGLLNGTASVPIRWGLTLSSLVVIS